MRLTTFEEFRELAKTGTFVPVWQELVADLLTPASAFLKIAEHSDYAFLLESVEGGERVARYSFLGKDPFLIIRARGGQTIIERPGQAPVTGGDFVATVRQIMAEFNAPVIANLPRFTGGAVGYLGYDAVPWVQPVNVPVPGSKDEGDDACFMVFDTILAFDHVYHRILIIANARVSTGDDLGALYQFACAKIGVLRRELERSLSEPGEREGESVARRPLPSAASFEAGVRSAKDYIAAGDVYQLVLSQRFDIDVRADPFTVYRALRHVNPSPYMYFLRAGQLSIVGSSPEMLVRVEGRHVETHPIAGTRARGKTAEEDSRLAEELNTSEKDRAEHVMLVDLGRNDLGRVCQYGSVKVSQLMGLERYSHVMHLVSIVEGSLEDRHDRLDALVACFPAGTVSGAPKIRAMELIAELETRGRGVYAGAVGYVDFAGNLDFCIAIRTIVIRDGYASVQAGAGIVADSDPQSEWEEACKKAEALMRAVDLAHAEL